jgi:outer membrane autotransporter protein
VQSSSNSPASRKKIAAFAALSLLAPWVLSANAQDLSDNAVTGSRQLVAPLSQAAIDSTQGQLDNVRNHLDQARASCRQARSGGAATVSFEGHSMATPKIPFDGFLAGQIDINRRMSNGEQTGYKVRSNGITLGGDASCGAKHIVGGAIGVYRGDSSLADGAGTQDAAGRNLSLFGSWLPFETMHVDLIGDAGQNDYDTLRNGTAGSFAASTGGEQYAALANVGVDVTRGATSFRPFLRMQHIEAKVHGFSENGAGDALALSAISAKSTLYTFGGQLDHTFGTGWGEVTPHVMAEVHRETADAGSVNAEVLADRLSSEVSAAPTDNTYGKVEIGTTLLRKKRWSALVRYERGFGRDDYRHDSYSANFRLEF